MRGHFFWRIAVLLGVLFIFTVGGVTLLFWLLAAALHRVVLPGGATAVLWAAGVLLLLLVSGVFAAGRALRRVTAPVTDVMEAAGRLAEGRYDVRVAERGPPEVRRLAHAFNQMAARLQAHEEQRRTLLADVTHELRTPLAVIQGNLEGFLDGVYPRDDAHLAPVLEEARVLSTLIEDLRTLALAETGALHLHREPTDLGVLLQDEVAAFRAQAEAAGVHTTLEAGPDLPVLEIDATRIRQVVGNLLANALQHTPSGGSVRVTGESFGEPAHPVVAVTVTDTGTGIAAEDLPRVFDRFYKSKDSRGSGLGLAIARNLVGLHGGEISATSAAGEGTTIRFTLPLDRLD